MTERGGVSIETGARFLQVDVRRIAYDMEGSGRTVIFVHAAIADRRMWNREMSVFAKGYQTVRFDMRGYSQS